MADLKFEIKKSVGIIGEGTKGWKKEVNLVSWNDRKPKLDIRDWDETHEKMGKGVTLNKGEVGELKKLLDSIDLDEMEA
ncbi:MAG: PC4/YdbC family ssDNA-binding protein [Clostridiaceae bacterium]